MPKRIRELSVGEQFNSWTVIEKLPFIRYTTYKCECICGAVKDITASNLLREKSKSCGKGSCKTLPTLLHGLSDTPLHMVWQGMRYRTKHPVGNNSCYLGINICKEWDTYTVFHDWAMNNGYSKGLSIDRIKGTDDYTPNNCRWVTPFIQSQNRKGWATAEVPYKGVFKSKPRAGKVIYESTGETPYYWKIICKGKKYQQWGFGTAEEAYEDKCNYIKKHLDGLAYP